ncbi:hypothetical protein [Sediminitomix flava]|uniref:Uncharacterized protein n=1 Tax=Sediminitomix flava TaxID=379075 RepID=A0A315ZZK8_SEDFL|nr:hypothetical protein [Sediminitomix flava]PWJ42807.1 hypothetical protein BC781_102353 [Sediminitomix flava]
MQKGINHITISSKAIVLFFLMLSSVGIGVTCIYQSSPTQIVLSQEDEKDEEFPELQSYVDAYTYTSSSLQIMWETSFDEALLQFNTDFIIDLVVNPTINFLVHPATLDYYQRLFEYFIVTNAP